MNGNLMRFHRECNMPLYCGHARRTGMGRFYAGSLYGYGAAEGLGVRRSTLRVSGLSFRPIITSRQPAIRFNPKSTGWSSGDLKLISTATRGAQAPRIRPALKTKPVDLFLISVGNLSDKNAGMGPNPLVASITSNAANKARSMGSAA